MWLAPTAIPSGPLWPPTIPTRPVPSRLASSILPLPKLAQYRWAPGVPVPVSASVAETAAFLLTAVSTLVSVTVVDGANCTDTMHDAPDLRSTPVQVFVVIANAAGPDSVAVTPGA